MEPRNQFTFYRSFYDSISRIKSPKDRAAAYDSLCAYALFGTEPNLDALPDAVAVTFLLSKPNLDASRKKAASGSKGGSSKRTGSKGEAAGSKPEANRKQTGSEKEREYEVEKEGEIEKEVEKEHKCEELSGGADESALARKATADELSLIGLTPEEAVGATAFTVHRVLGAAESLFRACGFGKPNAFDCRHVYGRTVMEDTPRGRDVSTNLLLLLKYAFEKAHAAGKPRDWNYVEGIMERLAARDITTVQQAREWDNRRPDLYGEDIA